MKIELWYIGKTSFPFIQQGLQEFTRRIKRYNPFDEHLVTDVKTGKKVTSVYIKSEESKKLLALIQPSDFVILLDENGKHLDSVEFSIKVSEWLQKPKKRIVFIVGGAWGFDESIYQRSDFKLSLSKMTYSHQLIRLIFVEQLYRAFTILRNEKYHNA